VSRQSRAPQRQPSLGCRILALGELKVQADLKIV
jgi:hypothetical protein